MAFDKAKVVRAAEKYLAQGKISAAIKEYRQIVENEPDDFTALNMLGDLNARSNKKSEAIECFSRIAQHYRAQGFNLKAIAMYKKIDRLQPGNPAIASTLAGLYEMQGLIVDARAQYMTVADALQRAGQTQKSLDVVRKVADLEPHNTEIRIKLANGYLGEGLREDAADAFAQAGEQFLARKNYDRALECFGRTIMLDPRNRLALNGILAANVARGTADEAAEILEKASIEAPGDVELLSMLAHAYVEAEDASNAERAVTALVKVKEANYPRFLEVAQLYLKDDLSEEAVRILSSVCDHVLTAGHAQGLIEILDEVLARNPEHLDGLGLLLKVSKWQCDDVKTRSALERLFEAAEALGKPEIERRALSELVHLIPDSRYIQRLEQLGGPLPGTISKPARKGAEGVPTFESFALDREEFPHGSNPAEDALVQGVANFEWHSPSETSDSSASFADLNEPEHAANQFEFETNSADGFVEFEASPAPPAEAQPRHEAVLNQELESVDFYIAQSYFDIARDTLEMLERQFGSHPLIEERKRILSGSDSAPLKQAPPVSFEVAAEMVEVTAEAVDIGAFDFTTTKSSNVAEHPPQEANINFTVDKGEASTNGSGPAGSSAKPVGGAKKPGLDPGLAAIFDEFKEAVEEDEPASDNGDYETHYNLGIAYKEMDLLDEAVEEFQQAIGMTALNDGTTRYLQCCIMLGHCFVQKQMPRLAVMWFKKGIEIPGLSEDEYQALRYDLGTAYEHMGELDSAIDVFTEVYGIDVSYRGVADKLRELQAQRTVK